MRKVIGLVLFVSISFSFTLGQAKEQLRHLTSAQKRVLIMTYQKGLPFGYGYTLTAIAWEESQFGKYKINVQDGKYGSFGVFHNLLESVCSRHSCSRWRRSRFAERLVFDYDFSFAEALSELKYWENYWTSKGVNRVWTHTVCSYNAGHSWRSGVPYRNRILLRIKALRHYIKEYNEKNRLHQQ